jgi:hypothetical protein
MPSAAESLAHGKDDVCPRMEAWRGRWDVSGLSGPQIPLELWSSHFASLSGLQKVHTRLPDGLTDLPLHTASLSKLFGCNAPQTLSWLGCAISPERVRSSMRCTSTCPAYSQRFSSAWNYISWHTRLARHTTSTSRPHTFTATRHDFHPSIHKDGQTKTADTYAWIYMEAPSPPSSPRRSSTTARIVP